MARTTLTISLIILAWILLRYNSLTGIEVIIILALAIIALNLFVLTVLKNSREENLDNTCPECKLEHFNGFKPCSAAIAQTRATQLSPYDEIVRHCNCCDTCRQKCLDAWWNEQYEEHKYL